MRFLKGDLTASQDLSAAALSYTTTYSKGFTDLEILIKFSGTVTETVTVTLDSVNGANYDTVLRSKSLYAENSFVYKTDMHFAKGDKIKVQCTNANGTGTAYLTVKAREIGG